MILLNNSKTTGMNTSTLSMFKRYIVQGFAAITLLLSMPIEGKAQSMDTVINATTSFLVRDWANDEDYNDWWPPQVMAIPASTKIFGACGDWLKGDHVGSIGSHYCFPSHTIILDIDQVTLFYNEFGPGAVAYIIAHEFGHAMQNRLDAFPKGSASELQADCYAGILINIGSDQLGITRKDVLDMSLAAYEVGSTSHGTGAQRSYALMAGMGIVDYGCTTEEMYQLANSSVNDSHFDALVSTRSSSGGVDLGVTPYPKTIKDLRTYLKW